MVAVALALIVVLSAAPGLWRALRAGMPQTDAAARDHEERAQRHAKDIERWRAQIDGRSMFFVPAAPPAPPTEPTVVDRGPPAPPSAYAGPRIVAIVGSSVWFENGDTAKAGADAEGGVKVVSVSPPWSARVLWRGAEFDVPLFDRTTDRFLQPTPEPVPADSPAEAQSSNSPQQGGL